MKKKNNISIQHFFSNPLFVLPEQNAALNDAIGDNQKGILVVYKDRQNQTELFDFLKKILAAAQLDIHKDILLLKAVKETSYSFIAMRTKVKVNQMLVFGLSPKDFGLQVQTELYQAFSFSDCQFLFVDELSSISKDQKLKGALWNNLKKMFLNQ